MCSFCGRPRNLRRELHLLGGLARVTITCETCHRTLGSYVETVGAKPAEPAPEPAAITPSAPARPAARTRAAKKPATGARKPATAAKSAPAKKAAKKKPAK